jgi:hypothetical protein
MVEILQLRIFGPFLADSSRELSASYLLSELD